MTYTRGSQSVTLTCIKAEPNYNGVQSVEVTFGVGKSDRLTADQAATFVKLLLEKGFIKT